MLFDRLFRPRSSVTTSHELDQLLRAGWQTHSGLSITPETALQVTTVYAAVRALSEGVASLPLLLYRRRADGGKERAAEHPLFRLLHRRPNPWQTSYEWREMMQGHVLLRGNAYSWKNAVANGRVRELIPLHPDRMEVEQADDFTLRYHYRPHNAAARTFTQNEVFHLRGLSSDGITGLNPIRLHRESIGLASATLRHGAALFGNGAQPGGVLEHPNALGDQALKHLQQSLEENYSRGNAHRPMVLEEGMKWHQVGLSNEDAQYLETRKFERSDIAAIFGVPPHKVGDLERATFSNIEQQSLEWVRDSLRPWLVRWEQALLRDVLPEGTNELFVEHLVEGLLRGDSTARKEFYSSMLNWGVLNPNEVRERENLNPRPGGDRYFAPGNVIVQQADGTPPDPEQGNATGT